MLSFDLAFDRTEEQTIANCIQDGGIWLIMKAQCKHTNVAVFCTF